MYTHVAKFTVLKYNFPILYAQIMSRYHIKLHNYHLNINGTRAFAPLTR